ncbi:MAG: serpin family protein, partial [Anaerolineae bacterium]
MKNVLRNTLIVIAVLGLVSCSGLRVSPDEGEVPGRSVRSEKERVTSPDVAAPDLAQLVNGNSGFAFDIYQLLKEDNDNVFYSPYSISVALAMTYAGARG